MNFLVRIATLSAAASLILSGSAAASIIFEPGKKAKFVAPGEEEISETALELFQTAQGAEKEGNLKRAVHAYKNIVKQYPRDALAASALYRAAELQEQLHEYLPAADSFRQLVEKYPNSPRFEEAIEAQFRIGEIYLSGKKKKILGISMGSSLDRAVTIFANVVRTAPYGKYTARAQFNIGLAREKQNLPEMAIEAYQAVVDKFPNEPVAADAQYQIGYIWLSAARKGTKDVAATTNATTAFQDFLLHYPHSEKAAQARANLELLQHKETTSSYQVAKFYDKQKYYRAAVIYYNEVIRQQPGSTESNLAKKRIDQLRKKVGEAALQPPIAPEAVAKKKVPAHGERMAKGEPAKPGAANNEAPLPAADTDTSLPPPASMAPDATTAPAPPSALPGTGQGADPASTPKASASPSP